MVLNEGSDHGVYDSTPTPSGMRQNAARPRPDTLLFIVLLAKVGALCATSDPNPRARAPRSASAQPLAIGSSDASNEPSSRSCGVHPPGLHAPASTIPGRPRTIAWRGIPAAAGATAEVPGVRRAARPSRPRISAGPLRKVRISQLQPPARRSRRKALAKPGTGCYSPRSPQPAPAKPAAGSPPPASRSQGPRAVSFPGDTGRRGGLLWRPEPSIAGRCRKAPRTPAGHAALIDAVRACPWRQPPGRAEFTDLWRTGPGIHVIIKGVMPD
jgi:hypothetical protein